MEQGFSATKDSAGNKARTTNQRRGLTFDPSEPDSDFVISFSEFR